MPLPKLTGPDTELHTILPLEFPTLRLDLRIVYVAGPVMDDISERGRVRALQRALDERASKVAAKIAEGMSAVEADAAVEPVGKVATMVDDIAEEVIAAGVAGFRSIPVVQDGTGGLGDEPVPDVWEAFTADDAAEAWATWPQWAKMRLYQAVTSFSQNGPSDPKAR